MNKIKIKDIPISERPIERLIKYGSFSISNEELISIIIKSGTNEYNVKELSQIILNKIGKIEELKNVTINNLTNIKGMGLVKSASLIAAIELGKRVYYEKDKSNLKLNNTDIIFDYFKDIFLKEKQENFYVLFLNTKMRLITYKLLFKGTINTSLVHPREIFKEALLESAYAIIIMHNHPSGDPLPSDEDIELTNKLIEIGKIMSIPVLDHIIFGKDKYYSFYKELNNKKTSV